MKSVCIKYNRWHIIMNSTLTKNTRILLKMFANILDSKIKEISKNFKIEYTLTGTLHVYWLNVFFFFSFKSDLRPMLPPRVS
jgi:hypothetical protein